MEEYWNYIKWLGKSLYAKEIQLLGDIDVSCIFHDEVNYKMLKNNLIIIIDCNSVQETIYKIYKYKIKIEEKYKIVDISIFKGNDTENFSETYLISIYCVDKNKYEENMSIYNEVFKCNLKRLKTIDNQIKEIFKQESEKVVEINNIPQNNNNTSINDLYCKMLKSINNKNKNDLSQLKSNRNKNMNKEFQVKKNYEFIKNKLLKKADVDYVDELLKIKNNKTIKGYIKKGKKFKKVKIKNYIDKILKNNSSSIVIINCTENKIIDEYIKIFESIKSTIIVISSMGQIYPENVVVMQSISKAFKLVKGYKVIYISDKNETINNEDIIKINVNEIKNVTKENIINKILENKQGLLAFSNLDHINSVKVLTGTFFNFNGSNYYSGGAERYLIDLHEVCKQLGMKLRIYQKANFEFFRYYNEIEVVGISNKKEVYNYEHEQNMGILEKYNSISKNKTKLNIYSSFLECYGNAMYPSIGVSHGVAWDYKKNKYNKESFKDKNWIIEAAISCDKLVSVDTNTANWFQTIDYNLGNSTEVVPNYVDVNEFTPNVHEKDSSNFVILYPRRLYEARGMYLLLNITDDLLKKYSNIEIHFVGKGFKEDTDKIQEKIDKWGKQRIKMYNCPPEKMYQVYKNADISIIPTLYSEGTSLSCLEAMSTENAVIATRVGGLTDLIINNYNGKLIEPNKESLYSAIIDFINNPELMTKCKKNAREVAKEFNKNIWIEKWKKIIKSNSKRIDMQENIYYNVVMIYVSDKNLQNSRIKEIILEKLMENNLVYIVNNNVDERESYGRLQYIKESEDLYRIPNLVLVDKYYENKDNVKGEYLEI